VEGIESECLPFTLLRLPRYNIAAGFSMNESLPAPEFARYTPVSETVPVLFADGPLSGLKLYVPKGLPGAVRIHGKRHGNHRIWITHYYIRQAGHYRHLRTDTDSIEERF
jgi:hypothetical protein